MMGRERKVCVKWSILVRVQKFRSMRIRREWIGSLRKEYKGCV